MAEVTSNVLRRRRWQETSRRLERAAGSRSGPERSSRAIHKLMLCSSSVMFFSETFPLSCKTGCRSDLDSPLRAQVVGTTCTIASFGKGKKMRGRDTRLKAKTLPMFRVASADRKRTTGVSSDMNSKPCPRRDPSVARRRKRSVSGCHAPPLVAIPTLVREYLLFLAVWELSLRDASPGSESSPSRLVGFRVAALALSPPL